MPRIREYRWDSWAEDTLARIELDEPDIIAVDTETSGGDFYDEPFAATLTWRGVDGSLQSGYIELWEGAAERQVSEARVAILRAALDLVPRWVFHNSKFDLQKLVLYGVIDDTHIARLIDGEIELHDTQTLYVLINENTKKALKWLAANVLGVEEYVCVEVKSGPRKGQFDRKPKEEYLLSKCRKKLGLKKEDGYHLLPRSLVIPYAIKDTEFTLLLFEKLMPEFEALDDDKLRRLYAEFMELKIVLLDMEADGFCLDLPYLDETTSDYGVKVMDGWDAIVELTGNPELNPQSPDQIKKAFKARGHTLESTAEAVLTELDDELAQALISYRSDKKTHTTYLRSMQDEHRDGLIHPNFNDDAARTGRMSSSAASNN